MARHVCKDHPEEAIKDKRFRKVIGRCGGCRKVMRRDNLKRHLKKVCVGYEAEEG